MVNCWIRHRNQDLPLGTKIRRQFQILGSALALLLLCSTSSFLISAGASAASTPKPKSSPTAKKKPAKKKPAKKKPAKKPAPRKISKPIPSPSPKWPPKGFKAVDGVYISTPKSERELVGVLSAKTTLLSEIQACDKRVCAVVYVASKSKCNWWEVQSIVIGRYADVLGNLRTLAGTSKAQEIKTIILISKEPVESYAEILNMRAFCRSDKRDGKVPSNTFTPNPELAPTPSATPSTAPTADPSPAATPAAS
ncbi:MAG: hypothetical protein ACKO3U_03500 [Actinomycetota bacterium]